jgi:hypothetical protein
LNWVLRARPAARISGSTSLLRTSLSPDFPQGLLIEISTERPFHVAEILACTFGQSLEISPESTV